MAGKCKRNKAVGKVFVLILPILLLNLLGICYSYWNDSINISVNVSTGYMQPCFIEIEDEIQDENKEEFINASIIEGNKLDITGQCYPGYNKTVVLKVKNVGTLPIVYKEIEALEQNAIVNAIQISELEGNIINVGEEKEIQLSINTEAMQEYNPQVFKYKLQFEQGIK